MRLCAHGNARSVTCAAPRQEMINAGVQPGTLFFDGWRDGGHSYGFARVVSASCGASAFPIEGWVACETLVVFEGWRPVFRDGYPTGDQTWERLDFSPSYAD